MLPMLCVYQTLPLLRRLNLSYCNVRNQLKTLLDGVRQRLVYVNLKDTRLSEDDLFFLAGWRTLAGLRELNLSCNDLQHLDQVSGSFSKRKDFR